MIRVTLMRFPHNGDWRAERRWIRCGRFARLVFWSLQSADSQVWAHWSESYQLRYGGTWPQRQPPDLSCALRALLRDARTPSPNLMAPGDWPYGAVS